MEEESMHTVEIHVQAMKKFFGLIDHYFFVFEDMEYHPGIYRLGNILPLKTTKGSHLVCAKILCHDCYEKLVAKCNSHEDKHLAMMYYPMINCESLTTGISCQSFSFLALPFFAYMAIHHSMEYAMIFILTVVVVFLAYSKFVFSRANKQKCHHLQEREIRTKNED
ncbi:ac81-like [Fopius arisanus]|nr:ac81-like [Fopius arisanus]